MSSTASGDGSSSGSSRDKRNKVFRAAPGNTKHGRFSILSAGTPSSSDSSSTEASPKSPPAPELPAVSANSTTSAAEITGAWADVGADVDECSAAAAEASASPPSFEDRQALLQSGLTHSAQEAFKGFLSRYERIFKEKAHVALQQANSGQQIRFSLKTLVKKALSLYLPRENKQSCPEEMAENMIMKKYGAEFSRIVAHLSTKYVLPQLVLSIKEALKTKVMLSIMIGQTADDMAIVLNSKGMYVPPDYTLFISTTSTDTALFSLIVDYAVSELTRDIYSCACVDYTFTSEDFPKFRPGCVVPVREFFVNLVRSFGVVTSCASDLFHIMARAPSNSSISLQLFRCGSAWYISLRGLFPECISQAFCLINVVDLVHLACSYAAPPNTTDAALCEKVTTLLTTWQHNGYFRSASNFVQEASKTRPGVYILRPTDSFLQNVILHSIGQLYKNNKASENLISMLTRVTFDYPPTNEMLIAQNIANRTKPLFATVAAAAISPSTAAAVTAAAISPPTAAAISPPTAAAVASAPTAGSAASSCATSPAESIPIPVAVPVPVAAIPVALATTMNRSSPQVLPPGLPAAAPAPVPAPAPAPAHQQQQQHAAAPPSGVYFPVSAPAMWAQSPFTSMYYAPPAPPTRPPSQPPVSMYAPAPYAPPHYPSFSPEILLQLGDALRVLAMQQQHQQQQQH